MIESIINKPIITLAVILGIVVPISTFIKDINIDASPDSLLLESDPDLEYYWEVHREYGTDEYIIVGYEPKDGLYTHTYFNTLLNNLRFTLVLIKISMLFLFHK